MNIDQGMFKFDFTDHHAILGVSLEADAKQIRKRYLKIARKLHPDSLGGASDVEKQQASEFLSKMVNPAYEKLTQDKEATEYKIVLKMRGQQLKQQQAAQQLQNPSAKELASSSNASNLYNSSLKPLAEEQYNALDQVLAVTGQISELNLAYLVSTADQGGVPAAPAPASAPPAGAAAAGAAPPPPPPAPASPRQHRASIIDSYLNRAKEFEQKKDYSRAILELREAVKSHPNNANCHASLANLYLKANQATMARIHLKKALDVDPDNPLAKGLAPKINQTAPSAGKASSRKGQSSNGKKGGGGLFGLFGGKGK